MLLSASTVCYCWIVFHCMDVPVYSSIPQLQCIWVFSKKGKLWINLLWTWESWFLWEHMFFFLLGRQLRMGLLDHMMNAAAAKSPQSCLTLCNPIDGSPPGSAIPGILQARILKWVAIPFSRGSSQLRDQTQVSCIAGRFSTVWATREAFKLHFPFLPKSRTVFLLWSCGSLEVYSLERVKQGLWTRWVQEEASGSVEVRDTL